MADTIDALTEKEKETLRLIARGHDAKSAARELDLSVHTINERLRNARRKLDVTSSREAARSLLESESGTGASDPQKLGYKHLGDADAVSSDQSPPTTAAGKSRVPLIGGIAMMTAFVAALAFAFAGPGAEQTEEGPRPDLVESADAEKVAAARQWLALVDAGDWQASYDQAGTTFKEPNTVATWRAASQQARIPLGDVISREMVSVQTVASPEQYEIVRFRSDFQNREGAIESVTLQREDGVLRVVGYFIT